MREGSRARNVVVYGGLGLLVGLVGKELDFPTLVSYHGDRSPLVFACLAAGALAGLTPLRKLVAFAAVGSTALWLLVAFTPFTQYLAQELPRRDPIVEGDAVFVLASGLQTDGDLSSVAMSRLLRGLELLGRGLAPRLVLSEHPEPWPRYRDAACELMDSFGMEHEIVTVGPVYNTRDEALAVGELARDFGLDRVLVVTSPSHSRRAALALEAEGVNVVSVPSTETAFNFENLGRGARGDDRIHAFGLFLHEYAGLLYYRFRGWIPS